MDVDTDILVRCVRGGAPAGVVGWSGCYVEAEVGLRGRDGVGRVG